MLQLKLDFYKIIKSVKLYFIFINFYVGYITVNELILYFHKQKILVGICNITMQLCAALYRELPSSCDTNPVWHVAILKLSVSNWSMYLYIWKWNNLSSKYTISHVLKYILVLGYIQNLYPQLFRVGLAWSSALKNLWKIDIYPAKTKILAPSRPPGLLNI